MAERQLRSPSSIVNVEADGNGRHGRAEVDPAVGSRLDLGGVGDVLDDVLLTSGRTEAAELLL